MQITDPDLQELNNHDYFKELADQFENNSLEESVSESITGKTEEDFGKLLYEKFELKHHLSYDKNPNKEIPVEFGNITSENIKLRMIHFFIKKNSLPTSNENSAMIISSHHSLPMWFDKFHLCFSPLVYYSLSQIINNDRYAWFLMQEENKAHQQRFTLRVKKVYSDIYP